MRDNPRKMAKRTSLMLLVGIIFQLACCHAYLDTPWSTRRQVKDEQRYVNRDWLRAEPLNSQHVSELVVPIAEHITKYEIELVCAEHSSPACENSETNFTLTFDYLPIAIQEAQSRMASQVWRDTTDGSIYGAMIVIDPETMPNRQTWQFLNDSNTIRNRCTRHVIGRSHKENLRYFRIHLDKKNGKPRANEGEMLRQFVDESMLQYFCSEYVAGGEHTVPIYPKQKADKFFIPYGFQKHICGDELQKICRNTWFADRCLMTKKVSSESCSELYLEMYELEPKYKGEKIM